MRRSVSAIGWCLAVLSVAGCAPESAVGPAPAVATAPAAPSKPAGGAAGGADAGSRTAIAGPEASRITYAMIGKMPPLGARRPKGIQYAPDGKVLTFLQRLPDSPEQGLFAFDLAARSTRQLLVARDLLKETKALSREEELRRERQRQFSRGITEYAWAKRANVMLIPFGGDIFLRDQAGSIVRLTDTAEPEIDPRVCDGGERVVFVRKGELVMIDVASKRETVLTKGAPEGVTRGLTDFNGQEEFGEIHGFWIAPGCDKVAYLEVDEREVGQVPVFGVRNGKEDLMMARYPRVGTKNPKVKIGVLDFATKKTTWLKWQGGGQGAKKGAGGAGGKGEGAGGAAALEEEKYFGRFMWSQDGKSLWLQAISRDQQRLALVRANARSGEAAEVLVETSPTWVELADMKLLERSPRFVWTSPVGGHMHLSLRDAETGASVAKLTSGDWDVAGITGVDEERGIVSFEGTKEGPTELHLYSAPLAGGGEAKRHTPEAGLHLVTVDKKGSGFVDAHSALDRPWKVVIRGADGAELGALPSPMDPELGDLKLRAPEIVKVRAASGDTMYGALLPPRTIEPGKRYPVVVMVYGGPGVQMVYNAWSPLLMWNHLADRGVAVFQLDNRGASGRGPAFAAPIYGRLGDVELEDQLAGLEYLKGLPYVDAARVGIYGHSYGGRMVLAAMFRAPDRFKVGVSASPGTDDRLYDTGYTERYMGLIEKNAKGYEATDITRDAGKLSGKLLVMHGLMDENVHFAHTAKLIDALVAADKKFDLMVFPGERHGYVAPAASQYSKRLTVEYLVDHL